MKIMYHVAHNWNDEQIKMMNSFDVFPKKGFTAVQIEEEAYKKLENYLIKSFGSGGIRYPEFTKDELKKSVLSAKNGHHINGYPMPDIDGGYKELTYDLTNYCPTCGIGLEQKSAFRLKNVPPTGKKQIFALNWVFDELFVEKMVYDTVFKPLGLSFREVLKYKKDLPFENTVQLIIPETQEKLNLKDYPIEVCSSCGKIKYLAMPQGFYPMYKNIISPIFKSHEYFGSGASAFKRIFLTKDLRDKLIKLKIEKENWYIPTKNNVSGV